MRWPWARPLGEIDELRAFRLAAIETERELREQLRMLWGRLHEEHDETCRLDRESRLRLQDLKERVAALEDVL